MGAVHQVSINNSAVLSMEIFICFADCLASLPGFELIFKSYIELIPPLYAIWASKSKSVYYVEPDTNIKWMWWLFYGTRLLCYQKTQTSLCRPWDLQSICVSMWLSLSCQLIIKMIAQVHNYLLGMNFAWFLFQYFPGTFVVFSEVPCCICGCSFKPFSCSG